MSTISGVTIIRNALNNGYPIAEVISCLKRISDEVVICDGFSTDGTYEYLQKVDGIKLYQDVWDIGSQNGLEFARITNLALDRCNCDYILYLQGDEIIHDHDLESLKLIVDSNEYNSITLKFYHIRYDFDYMINGGYDRAIRIIRNTKNIRSKYDAFDFDGEIHPICNTEFIVYHFGYVFMNNILNKMVNHANNFYKNGLTYLIRKDKALKYINLIDNGIQLNPLEVQLDLEPEYRLIKHDTDIPKIMERLRYSVEYKLP